MRCPVFVYLTTALLLVTIGCSEDQPLVPEQGSIEQSSAVKFDPERVAREIVAMSGWELGDEVEPFKGRDDGEEARPPVSVRQVDREQLTGKVAHYSYRVPVGDGPYDEIVIHRVVKENHPHRPIRTHKNIFLLHGDAVGFVKFLFGPASPSTPDDHAAAIYLAKKGVDVWGMDQDWILVPSGTMDFSFMSDWGLQHQVDNLQFGMATARSARMLTGAGFGKMNLLGYSSGGMTAYALANQETQIPMQERHVGGLIPADIPYIIDPANAAGRAFTCAAAADLGDALAAGIYQAEDGVLFLTLSALARSDPDGASPVFDGLTNLQAALMFVTQTWQFFPANDWWHYMGGLFEDGIPVSLEYTPIEGCLDFLATASPYEPNRFVYDYFRVFCNEESLPFTAHLAEITIPVLYLGAAGGLGEGGFYTTTLLGSSDITLVNPALRPPDEIASDIGHIDLWTATDAEKIFWKPLLKWIRTHTNAPGRSMPRGAGR
ncbi:MAG: hypothetical protein JSW67_02785 [Candidatus Latescibacterota bacterium]|nr:MAG: hypothetical protein JSW67_02785 [Candidatus Latescibacterota bacterium]